SHGLCFINPASVHGRYDSVPRETSHVPREVACHGKWLRDGETSLTAGEESAAGRVGTPWASRRPKRWVGGRAGYWIVAVPLPSSWNGPLPRCGVTPRSEHRQAALQLTTMD